MLVSHWWTALISLGCAIVVIWIALVVVLWRQRSDTTTLRSTLRLLPDLVRMLRRLAGDRALPLTLRVRLWLVLVYLASPIDLVPDFIPVIGYADDALIVVLVVRSVVRRAGPEALEQHWPGTPEGLAAIRSLARI